MNGYIGKKYLIVETDWEPWNKNKNKIQKITKNKINLFFDCLKFKIAKMREIKKTIPNGNPNPHKITFFRGKMSGVTLIHWIAGG